MMANNDTIGQLVIVNLCFKFELSFIASRNIEGPKIQK